MIVSLFACAGCSFPFPGTLRVVPQYSAGPYIIWGAILLGVIVLYACGFRVAGGNPKKRMYIWRGTVLLTVSWLLGLFMQDENYGVILWSYLFFIPNALAFLVADFLWGVMSPLWGIVPAFVLNTGLFYLICRAYGAYWITRKAAVPPSSTKAGSGDSDSQS